MMKNWQFCLLMSTVYLAPRVADFVNVIGGAVFLIASLFMMIKERP